MQPLRPPPPDSLLTKLDARFRRPLMSFFLKRVGSRTDAADLTQQVFLRILARDQRDRIEDPEAFVFTIASNLLRDRARRPDRLVSTSGTIADGKLVEDIVNNVMEDRSPERVLLAKRELSEVLRALDELGGRTRDIFILFRLENMKHRAIADLFGISTSTVEKHIMKATLHLVHKFRRRP